GRSIRRCHGLTSAQPYAARAGAAQALPARRTKDSFPELHNRRAGSGPFHVGMRLGSRGFLSRVVGHGRIRLRLYISAAECRTGHQGETMNDLDKGIEAADFELPRDGGGTIKLSDHRGRPVVLFFDPKDDTSGCTAEAIDFSALRPDFETLGAVVIGM